MTTNPMEYRKLCEQIEEQLTGLTEFMAKEPTEEEKLVKMIAYQSSRQMLTPAALCLINAYMAVKLIEARGKEKE
jgi:hypothetical protein